MDKKDISGDELKPFSHERIDPDNSYYKCQMINGKLFEMAVDNKTRFSVIKYDDVTVEYDAGTMRYVSEEKDIEFGVNYYEGMNTAVKEADAERTYYLSDAIGDFVYGIQVANRSYDRTFDLIAGAISRNDFKLEKVRSEKFDDGRTYVYSKSGIKEYEKLSDGTEITYHENGLKKHEKHIDGTEITYYASGYASGKIATKSYTRRETDNTDSTVHETYSVINNGELLKREVFSGGTHKLTEYYEGGKLRKEEMGEKTYYYDKSGELAFYEEAGRVFFMDQTASYKLLKKDFLEKIKEGKDEEAMQSFVTMCRAIDYKGHEYRALKPDGSLFVKNDLMHMQMQVLDDGKIAFGAIYEDRHWINETFKGNGIEWYWKASAIILDPETGNVVASCGTGRLNVRHRTDPNKDLWNKIDGKDFMEFDGETLRVSLKGKDELYTEASTKVDIEGYDQKVKSKESDRGEEVSAGMQKVRDMIKHRQHKYDPVETTQSTSGSSVTNNEIDTAIIQSIKDNVKGI